MVSIFLCSSLLIIYKKELRNVKYIELTNTKTVKYEIRFVINRKSLIIF